MYVDMKNEYKQFENNSKNDLNMIETDYENKI